jgi:arylsulfatase A-like enzyme
MFRHCFVVTLLALLGIPLIATGSELKQPNVLFIALDDLNHWVGYLGRNLQTSTPNIDKLAARGVSFKHSYTASPSCNPSRAALMSGMRPSTTGIYENRNDWRPFIDPDKTLISTFRRSGYVTLGAGKIYHGAYDRQEEWDDYLRTRSGKQPVPEGSDGVGGIKFGAVDARDEDLEDYHIVSYGIEQLGKSHEKPFLLTIGLHKPHMPWFVPRKYFDLHPLDQIELPPSKEGDLDDVPPAGLKMAKPAGDHHAMVESGRWKEAVQAYLAAVSYADAQVGRLLEALDKSAHASNTIIVLWGDHGWHLGEKSHWRKFALWEESTRTPLIWVAPGLTKAGGVSERTVDLMSLYPTLTDLVGIAKPAHVEGESIRSLLADPAAPWDKPAISTYLKGNHAVRSEAWRYIRYANGDEELYDERNDPYEWSNLAGKPDLAGIKSQLAAHLPGKDAEEIPARQQGKGRKKRATTLSVKDSQVPASFVKQQARPNIVVLIADDLGSYDVGWRGSEIKTPSLDKLAASGARLNQFYVQPVCSPTRAAFMTGRYPFRYGFQSGVVRPWAQHGLPLEERLLSQGLKEVGYETAISGKWHLGHFEPAYLPTRRGFDHQYGHYNGALDYFTHVRDEGFDWHRNDEVNHDEGYSTDLIAAEAVRRIRERDKSKPLFLYVPFNGVHAPLQVPAKYEEPYAHLSPRRRTYAGMVAAMDAAVGRIHDAIREAGMSDNTLVIFSSDNGGPNPGQLTDNGPLRAGKGSVYEGGVRVVAVASWPGKIKAGTTIEEPIHIVDLHPTLLKLGGASLEQKLPLDGKDVLAVLTEGASSPHEQILLNTNPQGGAILVGDWKLVVHEPGAGGRKASKAREDERRLELYHLAEDLGEKQNLAAEHPGRVADLLERYQAFAQQAVPPKSEAKPKGFVTPKVWGQSD